MAVLPLVRAGGSSELPNYGQITEHGYGFGSIIRALERLLLMVYPILPRNYNWNFQGITEALWDLSVGMSGHLEKSSIGTMPPGSSIDTSTGIVTLVSSPDGSFWFDTRQGRLFVSVGGQWYQTNGAESAPYIGAYPPVDQSTNSWSEKPGQLWLCTRDGRLYLYVADPDAGGEPGWYELSGGGGGGGPSQALLNDLIDVNDTLIKVDWANQGGVLLRDLSKKAGDSSAYVVTDDIDLGKYT